MSILTSPSRAPHITKQSYQPARYPTSVTPRSRRRLSWSAEERTEPNRKWWTHVTLNFTSAVLVVISNKWLLVHLYPFPLVLAGIHSAVTYVGLLICSLAGIFKPKPIPVKELAIMSLWFSAFVATTNYSLLYNSVAFYQTAKIATVPMVVFLEKIVYKRRVTMLLAMTMTVIILGILSAIRTDPYINETGLKFATVGIVAASCYQLSVQRQQKQSGVNGLQLLFYQAPLSAAILIVCSVFFEDTAELGTLLKGGIPTKTWVALIISSLSALLLNVSSCLSMISTSPVLFNTIGTLKLAAILFGGSVLLGEHVPAREVVSITTAVAGVMWYSNVRYTQVHSESASTPRTPLERP